jgi:hypothetical protein
MNSLMTMITSLGFKRRLKRTNSAKYNGQRTQFPTAFDNSSEKNVLHDQES